MYAPFRINPNRFSYIRWVVRHASNDGNRTYYVLQGTVDPLDTDYYRFDLEDPFQSIDLNNLIGTRIPRLLFASWEWAYQSTHTFYPSPSADTIEDNTSGTHRYTPPAFGHSFFAKSPTYTGHFEVTFDPEAKVSEEEESRLWNEVLSIHTKFAEKHRNVPLVLTPDFTKVTHVTMETTQGVATAFEYTPSMCSDLPSFMCVREDCQSRNVHMTHNMLQEMFWFQQQDPYRFMFEDHHTKLTAFYQSGSTYNGGIWF